VGKRTRNTCRNLFKKINNRIKSPSPDSKLEMYSDGNNDYTEIIKEFYPLACVDYGQLIKVRKGGRVVDKIKRVVFGEPNPDNIETTDVENMNSIMRERIGRLVRDTKCHSKKGSRLCNAIEFFQFYWDFMDPLPNRGTPGMEEGLTDRIWSWDDFLSIHYAP